jgi:hypothetical protein
VGRLKRLIGAVRRGSLEQQSAALCESEEIVAALRSDASALNHRVNALRTQVADARRRSDALLESARTDLGTRAAIAALPHARLMSDSIALDGSPSQRLRIARIPAGVRIERPFSRWIGVTRCAGVAADVRAMWERLLDYESRGTDDILRAFPSSILDIPGGVVSSAREGSLHVSLRAGTAAAPADGVVAIPRFFYALPPRKLRNFGHWLLDCVPQIVALAAVAPDARFLVPNPFREFQRSTLALAQIAERQAVPWDGAPLAARRLLVMESDGRAGGGRPLGSLLELRRRMAPPEAAAPARGTRRIYVSRRDARRSRRWIANEPEVEALFESRGFEIVVMADCPLDEQVRIFREASVVAGVSGAGLTNIVFSPPGTHVVVLLSEGLMRWYADETGARSLWASGRRVSAGQLAALGDSPRFYAHLAATYEQFCHSFVAPDHMPIDSLSAFLEETLARVGDA